jgi:hypothetical protein
MFVGFNQFEEEVEVVVFDIGMDQFFSLTVHDADIHLPGVQVDSAVELRGGSIILHTMTQCWCPFDTGYCLVTRGVLVTLPAQFQAHATKKTKRA